MAIVRICFVGDSITLGSGDDGFLGWPGRLCVSQTARGHDVTLYNLGVRGDTTDLIRPRWRSECGVRLPAHVNGRLVFSFGVNDMAEEEGAGIRVPLDRSLENARAILAEARDWLPTLMVGPVPTVDDMQPYIFPSGIAYRFVSERAAVLSDRYAELCRELRIPYLDLYAALSREPAWEQHQRAMDGVHAVDDGYALIAEKISQWSAWRAWFAD